MRSFIGFFALATAVCLFMPARGFAQIVEAWSARYDGPTHDIDSPSSIAVDDLGNVYVTGSSRTAGFSTEDYTTIKYSPSGDTLWVKKFNGTGGGTDFANAIALGSDGSIYVTGQSWGLGTAYDFLTIKYNAAGDTLWTRRYNGPRNGGDIAHAIVVDEDGNAYVTGESEGLIGTHGIFEDYATVKYSSTGSELWSTRYNGPAGDYDRSNAVAVDISGNVFVTGMSDGGSSGSGMPHFDYATIKYDSLGMVQWVRRHNGDNGDDEATDVTLDDAGNVYVTGSTHRSLTDLDFGTLKYSSTGDSLWLALYNGPADNSDEAVAIEVDNDGNAYVTGRSYGGPGTDYDYATVRYDSFGDSVWVRRYNGPAGYDESTCLALDPIGNVYVSGYSNGGITGSDFTTLMYDSAGDQQWVISYSNFASAGSEDLPFSIAVDSMQNVYVTGSSGLDYATLKYSPTVTGVEQQTVGKPGAFQLFQNYPNPFNPTTAIGYQLTAVSRVSLKIYDLLGREVATLVDETKAPGNYQVAWDASGQASGVYFYRLTTGRFVETRKLELLR